MRVRAAVAALVVAVAAAGCDMELAFDQGACGAAADIATSVTVAATAAADDDDEAFDEAMENIIAAAERLSDSSSDAVREMGPQLSQAAADAQDSQEIGGGDVIGVLRELASSLTRACMGKFR